MNRQNARTLNLILMRGAAVGLVLLGIAHGLGAPQHTGDPTPQMPSGISQIPDASNRTKDDPGRPNTGRLERLQNEERQKRLVADTDKLLLLATQLHDDVAKTDKNILSIDVVKRADEIEKLAHSVKERMKS